MEVTKSLQTYLPVYRETRKPWYAYAVFRRKYQLEIEPIVSSYS